MNLALWIVAIALALFVAWGRFGPYSFTPKLSSRPIAQ
jgi:hypothetical protein